MFDRVRHAAFVGVADATLVSCKQVEIRIGGHGFAHEVGGSVGGIVVDYEDVEIVRRDALGLFEDARQDDLQVGALVVGGQDDAGDGASALGGRRHLGTVYIVSGGRFQVSGLRKTRSLLICAVKLGGESDG